MSKNPHLCFFASFFIVLLTPFLELVFFRREWPKTLRSETSATRAIQAKSEGHPVSLIGANGKILLLKGSTTLSLPSKSSYKLSIKLFLLFFLSISQSYFIIEMYNLPLKNQIDLYQPHLK